jgi:signal transduction histidine kinase
LSDPDRHVDGTGLVVPVPRPGPGLAVTALARGGRTIALVVHDPSVLPPGSLDEHLGPAARLAVENERLSSQLQAQVRELRESQTRIVASGDASRQRLERDLHDGAQQSLIALTFELRVARAQSVGDPAVTEALDATLTEASQALDELRELAHGIHPAVLSQAGLAVALLSLVDSAPVAVELVEVPDRRLAADVELAAFLVVTDLIEQGADLDVLQLAVSVAPGELLVDASAPALPSEHVLDRIGALGGSVDVTPTGVRVVIPCG